MGRAESGARSVISIVLLVIGVLILLFGIWLAVEAMALTFNAIVDIIFGAILIVLSRYI
jgi:uncharacterized membrane protein YiaA